MSVIVWDGKTLAADRQGTTHEMRITEPKLRVLVFDPHTTPGPSVAVCAWTGVSVYGQELAQWYFDGADKSKYPEFQKDKEDWCRLIVADTDGCRHYERTPYPLTVNDPYMAWGGGRDFAMGALAMGADARKAVEVTNLFSIGCGGGVDAYDLLPTVNECLTVADAPTFKVKRRPDHNQEIVVKTRPNAYSLFGEKCSGRYSELTDSVHLSGFNHIHVAIEFDDVESWEAVE